MRILSILSILFLLNIPALTAQTTDIKDTLYVSGKAVVFFGPSQSEYVSMTHAEKDAIDEHLYDFYHYRSKVLTFLKSNEIQDFETARSKIQIQLSGNESIIYTRSDFDDVVGLIMTDGVRDPEVKLGVYNKSELISLFAGYFGLE